MLRNGPPTAFFGLLLLASLLLTACDTTPAISTPVAARPTATGTSSTEETAPPTQENQARITLTIWQGQWSGDYLQAVARIFQQYTQAHPHITIKLMNVQQDMGAKIRNAVPQGVGPDIIIWDNNHIGELAQEGMIQPLDGVAGIDQVYLTDNFVNVGRRAVTYNRKIYGLPQSLFTVALLYNKALVSAADLPQTTTALREQMQTYRAAHPGKYYAVWNVEDGYSDAFLFYGAGAQYVDEQGHIGFNTPEAVATARYIHSLQELLPMNGDYNTAEALFLEGNTPLLVDSPWFMVNAANAQIDAGVARLPMVDFGKTGPARPFVAVTALMLEKGSAHPTEAVELMKYFAARAQQRELAHDFAVVPAYLGSETESMLDPTFIAQDPDGEPLPNTPFMAPLWKPLNQALTILYTQSSDPLQVMNDAQKAAETAIANMH
jgi:maltose-binding protein MalE